MQTSHVHKQTYYLLRFWCEIGPEKNRVRYAQDVSHSYNRREWWTTISVKAAYQFKDRSDAKRAIKSPVFKDLVEGPRSGYRNCERLTDRAYFWEIVEVIETVETSFEELTVDTNAPAMVVIARAGE